MFTYYKNKTKYKNPHKRKSLNLTIDSFMNVCFFPLRGSLSLQSPEEPLINYCAVNHQQVHVVTFLGTVRRCHLGMSL